MAGKILKNYVWTILFLSMSCKMNSGSGIDENGIAKSVNVEGGKLEICSTGPLTGFYRNGRCDTGRGDDGVHTVCIEVTESFLIYSLERGNDLITPRPERHFEGLEPGDRWCVCAERWKESVDEGIDAPVLLSATHEATLRYISLKELDSYKIQVLPKIY